MSTNGAGCCVSACISQVQAMLSLYFLGSLQNQRVLRFMSVLPGCAVRKLFLNAGRRGP